MTTAEERIKQCAKLGTEIENLLDTDLEDEWKQVAEIKWVKLEEVLQILADYVIMPRKELKTNLELLASEFEPAFKVVDMEKWRELLKLLQTFPKVGNTSLGIEGYNFPTEFANKCLEWRQKIEEKLEKIEQ